MMGQVITGLRKHVGELDLRPYTLSSNGRLPPDQQASYKAGVINTLNALLSNFPGRSDTLSLPMEELRSQLYELLAKVRRDI